MIYIYEYNRSPHVLIFLRIVQRLLFYQQLVDLIISGFLLNAHTNWNTVLFFWVHKLYNMRVVYLLQIWFQEFLQRQMKRNLSYMHSDASSAGSKRFQPRRAFNFIKKYVSFKTFFTQLSFSFEDVISILG